MAGSLSIDVRGIEEVKAALVEAERIRAERDLLRDALDKHSRLLKMEFEALDRHLAAVGGPPSENERKLVGMISRAYYRLLRNCPPENWAIESLDGLRVALRLLGEDVG